MAFKIKIITALLLICLIDSIHSTKYVRTKRDTEETTVEDKKKEEPNTENKGPETSTDKTGTDTTTKGPIPDVSEMFGNIGQLFSVSSSTNWMKDANSWFTNVPGWFGGSNKKD